MNPMRGRMCEVMEYDSITLASLRDWAYGAGLVWCKTSDRTGFTWIVSKDYDDRFTKLITKGKTEKKALWSAFQKLG